MLVQLQVENLALIDRLSLSFEGGLVAFTGETGAGKSVLLSALTMLVGERASADSIRTGADEAWVEALFDTAGDERVAALLDELGLPPQDDGTLLVARRISRSGRNRCFVNGHLAVLAALRSLGDLLVDIHGQHAHQRLMGPAHHLDMVDQFGDEALRDLRERVRNDVAALRELRRRVETARSGERERRIEISHLRSQLDEIEAAAPEPGEDRSLHQELKRLSSAKELLVQAHGIRQILLGDEEGGVLEGLRRAQPPMDELLAVDDRLRAPQEQLAEATCLVEDLASTLRDWAETIEIDSERQAVVEARLGELHRLTRKYGGDCDELLAYARELEDRLAHLEGDDVDVEALRRRLVECEGRLAEEAADLSARRRELARRLEKAVDGEIAELAMADARLKVELRPVEGGDGYAADGADRCEFLLRGNPGEEWKPLARIASGGELSRLALGIKCALASQQRVPLMVFDEVDTGIGGTVATRVGQKLLRVASHAQCLCITHSPQIAALARQHWAVEKVPDGDGKRRIVAVREVRGREREAELARMLGGESQGSLERARELLDGQHLEHSPQASSSPPTSSSPAPEKPAPSQAPAAKAPASQAPAAKASASKASAKAAVSTPPELPKIAPAKPRGRSRS